MPSGVKKWFAKVIPVGNSKGIRVDSAFFKAHPEFEGEVSLTVIGEGQALLSARLAGKAKAIEIGDPVLLGFLRFLEAQMTVRPERIVAADPAQLARIAKLVKSVRAG